MKCRLRWAKLLVAVAIVLTSLATGTTAVADTAPTVEVSASRHTVDQSGSSLCGDASACSEPIAGAVVRLFRRNGDGTPRYNLPARFNGAPVDVAFVAECETGSDGACSLAAPTATDYEVIMWFTDIGGPTQCGLNVYVGRNIDAVDFENGTASVNIEVHRTIRSDGSVRYSGGRTQVVCG